MLRVLLVTRMHQYLQDVSAEECPMFTHIAVTTMNSRVMSTISNMVEGVLLGNG